MTAWWNGFTRLLRRVGRMFWWALLLLPFLAIPANVGIEYSNSPDFCSSCHIMEPYHESWKAGSHAKVSCVECHYPPDLKGKLWTKFQGLNQVVSYVTATESTRPSAHVVDGACTQCHPLAALPGRRKIGSIEFDHGPHLDAARPGHELNCVTCHPQMTVDSHMSINLSACMLCHFKDQPIGQAVGGCQACHPLPDLVLKGAGLDFDHATVTERGIECAACHRDVVAGAGEVVRSACLQCHAAPTALAAFDAAAADPEVAASLHRKHVKQEHVDCSACHGEIRHGRIAKPKRAAAPPHAAVVGECSSCHSDRHRLQADFGEGRGARGIDGAPDFMVHVGMACEACHATEAGGDGAPPGACFSCHGRGVRGMVDAWKRNLDAWHATMTGNLERVAVALGDKPPGTARDTLADVRWNVELVRRADGVHNIAFAQAIFRQGQERLTNVARDAGVAVTLEPVNVPSASNDCRACHMDADRIAGSFGAYPFPHAPHVGKAGLSCGDCHQAGTPHGRVTIGSDSCTECHHEDDAEDCAKCHSRVAAFYDPKGARFPAKADAMAAQVPCVACHTDRKAADQRAVVRKACVECHDAKYGDMLDAWTKEAAPLLATLAGLVDDARTALLDGDRTAPGYAEARAIVDDAEASVAAIRAGHFSHNPEAARALVATLRADVVRVRNLVGAR